MATVAQIVKRLGISATSVRSYAGLFADHLSPGAKPGAGHKRAFTEDDVRVLATARALLAEGLTYEQVGDRLAGGIALLEGVEVPPPPEPKPEPASTALVPVSTVQVLVQQHSQELARAIAERDAALAKVEALQRELGRAEGELQQRRRPWWARLLGR